MVAAYGVVAASTLKSMVAAASTRLARSAPQFLLPEIAHAAGVAARTLRQQLRDLAGRGGCAQAVAAVVNSRGPAARRRRAVSHPACPPPDEATRRRRHGQLGPRRRERDVWLGRPPDRVDETAASCGCFSLRRCRSGRCVRYRVVPARDAGRCCRACARRRVAGEAVMARSRPCADGCAVMR